MQSMMEELYWGNISFTGGFHGKDSPYVKAARIKHDCYTELMGNMSTHQKDLFDQYINAWGDMEATSRYNAYANALQFGIRLMVEAFAEEQ